MKIKMIMINNKKNNHLTINKTVKIQENKKIKSILIKIQMHNNKISTFK